jgi:peptidoglycan/LPS O-acetylase OafA/YrhL
VIFFIRKIQSLKNFLIIFFLTALITRITLWYYDVGHEAFYYNTLARLDTLAAGSFLAILVFQGKKISGMMLLLSFLSACAVILSAIFISHNLDHYSSAFASIGYSVLATFFMCCTFFMMHANNFLAKCNALRFIGRISYGIYIYHLPVYLAGSYLLSKSGLTNASLLFPAISIVATLLISICSYKFLELPLLRYRNKFTQPTH